MATYFLLRMLAVVLLVAANAFFVAAEFALVSVRDTRLQQLVEARRIGARTVQRLHAHLDEVLAAVQLGVTVASLGLGWLGESTLAHVLEPLFRHFEHRAVYAHAVALVLAFALITYLHTTLGELVPKSVALHRAERVALTVAAPMEFFIAVMRPFLYVMTHTARFVLRLFGVPQIRQGGVHSPEELKLIVTASRRLGLVPPFQEELIHRTLEMGDVVVREIMVPRPDIFSLPADLPLEEALARVVEEQHSRVPVFDPQRGPEHIIGLLYSKDLTRWMRLRLALPSPAVARLNQMQVRQIMRNVLVVPETKALPDLLLEFKQNRRHLAVVADEFGSIVGLVTVEDVLEQLVGEIEDEFDVTPQPLPAGASTMILDGSVPLRDLETQYQLSLPREEGYETLAGFLLARLQKIPRGGESVVHEGRRFTVAEMEGRRIAKVKVEAAEDPVGKNA
jgi:CBS domain containing-hemolysin-like protein